MSGHGPGATPSGLFTAFGTLTAELPNVSIPSIQRQRAGWQAGIFNVTFDRDFKRYISQGLLTYICQGILMLYLTVFE